RVCRALAWVLWACLLSMVALMTKNRSRFSTKQSTLGARSGTHQMSTALGTTKSFSRVCSRNAVMKYSCAPSLGQLSVNIIQERMRPIILLAALLALAANPSMCANALKTVLSVWVQTMLICTTCIAWTEIHQSRIPLLQWLSWSRRE
ncbi:hypothetical protein GGH99_006426, partial [Coemansia sp. RSA 1285]